MSNNSTHNFKGISMGNSPHSAMLFSMERHGTQKRKFTGEPYWKHAAEVAAIVQTAKNCTPEMVAAAWLHDVLEDTNTTKEDLNSLFGEEVTRLVVGLTDVSKPDDGNRQVRKAMDRDHLAKGCRKIQTIKLADMISNTASVAIHDPVFASMYLAEKRELLSIIDKADEQLKRTAFQMVIDAELEAFASLGRLG
jgi:(p)ppGpp synthase/HD superfamily hydrolase